MSREEEQMCEMMQGGRLADLYPEFDKEVEWQRLDSKLKYRPVKNIWMGYLKVAAIVALAVSLGGVALHSLHNKSNVNIATVAPVPPQKTSQDNMTEIAANMGHDCLDVPPATKNTKHAFIPQAGQHTLVNAAVTEPICNATQCALEICILQTMKCGNGKETEISDCRTIEPDQEGRLRYKDPAIKTGDCGATVDEIRITRVNTGETIIINASSQPASASDVMRCLTGTASCNMLAGMFETDCDNEPMQGKLKN